MHSHKQHRHTSNSSAKKTVGRGFFVALTVCLIAVGGVAAVTFSDSLTAPPTVTDDPVTTTSAMEAAHITAPSTTRTTNVTTSTTTATVTTTTTTTVPATPLYVLPLSNTVLTAFSEQPLFNDTLKSYQVHAAVDFDGEEGQSVRALAAGTVTAVEDDPLWGPCITVDHGSDIVSIYRGVSPSVEAGAVLEVGAAIGVVDAIPCEKHLGPHLHLELYRNGEAVDVTALLKTQLNR